MVLGFSCRRLLAAWLFFVQPVCAAVSPPGFLPVLEERSGVVSALQAQELHDYFRSGSETLDAFCGRGGACTDRQARVALYQRFFQSALSRGEDDVPLHADMAYARQAAAYFSEPDYACRQPLTARVLERLWQRPQAARACTGTLPFLLDTENAGRQILWLDADRVAEVHLLFAGGSGAGMSRFGHVALRLVVCAPERAQVGPSCAEDLSGHVALGFRAGIDDPELSIWKGLTGGYVMRLFADPFMKVYSNYTTDEFRSLTSLPLRLSSQERELLLQALAEVHWRYRGRYRFFTQNCASELSWLLQVVSAVTGSSPPWLEKDNVRPDRLYAQALHSPAFAADVLSDLSDAEKQGFYFPDSAPYYQMALDTVLQRLHEPGMKKRVPSFRDVQGLDALTRRQSLYEPALSAVPGAASAQRAAHAALVLEAWMERRLRRELLLTLARYYLRITELLLEETDFFNADEEALLRQCLAGFGASDQLGGFVRGIPSSPPLPQAGCDMASAEFRAMLEKLYRIAPLPAGQDDKLAQLGATVDNVNWLLPQTGLVSAGNP